MRSAELASQERLFVPLDRCWVCGGADLARFHELTFDFTAYKDQDPELFAYTGRTAWLRWCRGCGFGQQYLLAVAGDHHSRQPIERRRKIIAIDRPRFADVDRHPHSYLSGGAEIGSVEGVLSGNRGADRGGDGGKSGLHRVADRLEHHPALGLDCSSQEIEMMLHCQPHRGRVALPSRRASLDIREEESNGASRVVGHRAR